MIQKETENIIGNHTNDEGVVDFKAINSDINVAFDKVIANKVDHAKKEVASGFDKDTIITEGQDKLIKELGFDNKDALTGAINSAQADDKELLGKVKNLESERDKFKKDLTDKTKSFEDLNKTVFKQTVTTEALKAGINPDMIDDFNKVIDFKNIDTTKNDNVVKHIGKTLEEKTYFLTNENNKDFGKIKAGKAHSNNGATAFSKAMKTIK